MHSAFIPIANYFNLCVFLLISIHLSDFSMEAIGYIFFIGVKNNKHYHYFEY